jgi:hypothetical protein
MLEKTNIYIDPITSIHSNFAEAKEFYDKSQGLPFLFREEKKLSMKSTAR